MIKKAIVFMITVGLVISILNAHDNNPKPTIESNSSVEVPSTTIHLVYVTPKGGKYHLKNCRTINNSKIINEITLGNAIKKGYEACKVCNPRNGLK